MADIEHRDIPDSGRHEPKGASTAITDTVVVADGVGGTSFKKITGASLQGSVGAGPVSLKSNGEFTTSGTPHATINKTSSNAAVFVGSNSGIILQSGHFRVEDTGVYLVSVTNGLTAVTSSTLLTGNQIVSNTTIRYPEFRNITSNTQLFTGVSCLVVLTAGVTYGWVSNSIQFNIARVS